jgi:hypothetical protein
VNRIRQQRQHLQPSVHDLAAQGRELLVPGRKQPAGIGPAPEVTEKSRPLLEREPVAPARFRVHRHEFGCRAVQVGAPEMRTAREQGQIGRREAHGAGPRAEHSSHLDPSLARE